MPYLSTSQEFLKESALLLAAYPETTRITTKYSYPKKSKSKSEFDKTQSSTPADASTTSPATPAAPQQYASLTLKTYHPASGICLKYTTNKAAEVGRLIASLGKLASGAPVEDAVAPVVSGAGTGGVAVGEAADVEMGDSSAPATGAATPVTGVAAAAAGGAGGGAGVSKKGKKKGKGKR